jgi:hypothetical protein
MKRHLFKMGLPCILATALSIWTGLWLGEPDPPLGARPKTWAVPAVPAKIATVSATQLPSSVLTVEAALDTSDVTSLLEEGRGAPVQTLQKIAHAKIDMNTLLNLSRLVIRGWITDDVTAAADWLSLQPASFWRDSMIDQFIIDTHAADLDVAWLWAVQIRDENLRIGCYRMLNREIKDRSENIPREELPAGL